LRVVRTPGIFRAPRPVSAAAVPVVLFTDFASPFARVTEAALVRLVAAGEARATLLAFEVSPVPASLVASVSRDEADAVAALAGELGIRIDAHAAPVRTRKAHEAAAHAAARGAGPEFREAVWEARFAGGADIGRVDVLVALGAAVGLDRTELRVVLDVDRYAPRIAAENEAARAAGVEAVPTLVAGEGDAARWQVGALSLDDLRRWIRRTD
jgi:predicted DsbA family dithiol-disulfide isomerase